MSKMYQTSGSIAVCINMAVTKALSESSVDLSESYVSVTSAELSSVDCTFSPQPRRFKSLGTVSAITKKSTDTLFAVKEFSLGYQAHSSLQYPTHSTPKKDKSDSVYQSYRDSVYESYREPVAPPASPATTVWAEETSDLGSSLPSSEDLRLSELCSLPAVRPQCEGKEASPVTRRHHSQRRIAASVLNKSAASDASSFMQRPLCATSVAAKKLYHKSISKKLKTIGRNIRRKGINSMHLETLGVLWCGIIRL